VSQFDHLPFDLVGADAQLGRDVPVLEVLDEVVDRLEVLQGLEDRPPVEVLGVVVDALQYGLDRRPYGVRRELLGGRSPCAVAGQMILNPIVVLVYIQKTTPKKKKKEV
jgi:hypothetical protein